MLRVNLHLSFSNLGKIAQKHLLPELAGSKLTLKLCNRVAEAFVTKYGKYAGWAQAVLFIAELPSQKALLPLNLRTTKQGNPTKRENSVEEFGKKNNCSLLIFDLLYLSGRYLLFIFSIRLRYKYRRLRCDTLQLNIYEIERGDITLQNEG